MSDIIKGYHATGKSIAKIIIENQRFNEKEFDAAKLTFNSRSKQLMPGDLGMGTYFYIDENKGYIPAKDMAVKYYNSVKREKYKEAHQVIECIIDTQDANVLDLNEEGNLELFNNFKNSNVDKLKRFLKDAIIPSPAQKRNSIQGIALELIILKLRKEKNFSTDIVIKDSITEIEDDLELSYNGTEACVKTQKLISNIN